jgi:hypothetical protein
MVQQMGRSVTWEDSRDIYAYADLTTSLDPKFWIVYWYAALSMPFNEGRHWQNTRESTAIVRKGLKAFPDDFKLNFILAYNLQYFEQDYLEAARLVKWLSGRPGSPPYLSALATRLLAQTGQFDSGIAMAAAMRDQATSPEERQFYARRILQLQQEQVLQAVDAAYERFKEREHRPPLSVEELLISGDLSTPPVDPLGGTITFDADGISHSTESQHRLVLYEKENS